jgi:hypothetical protein
MSGLAACIFAMRLAAIRRCFFDFARGIMGQFLLDRMSLLIASRLNAPKRSPSGPSPPLAFFMFAVAASSVPHSHAGYSSSGKATGSCLFLK